MSYNLKRAREFVNTAPAGTLIVYWTGDLARDRDEDLALDEAARWLWRAAVTDKVDLFKKRRGGDLVSEWHYIAVKR